MRSYYRLPLPNGGMQWVVIEPPSTSPQDLIYVVTLIQNLLLVLGESPFFANNGIPAQQAVMQQVFPDYYVYQIQQQFAPYFISLTIQKQNSTTPTYNILCITHSGVALTALVTTQGVLYTTQGQPIITTQTGQEILI